MSTVRTPTPLPSLSSLFGSKFSHDHPAMTKVNGVRPEHSGWELRYSAKYFLMKPGAIVPSSMTGIVAVSVVFHTCCIESKDIVEHGRRWVEITWVSLVRGWFDLRYGLKHVGQSVWQGGCGICIWLTMLCSGLRGPLEHSDVSSVLGSRVFWILLQGIQHYWQSRAGGGWVQEWPPSSTQATGTMDGTENARKVKLYTSDGPRLHQ